MAQFPPHRISNTDDLRSGNAVSPNRALKGVPLTGAEAQSVVVLSLGAPAAASANAAALSQAVGLGANFVLNGALAGGSPVVATFPTPRNVVAAWTNTAILTIRGTDVYGQALVEVTASGATHTGLKAFKTITSITSNASITGATVGTGVAYGLPYRPAVGGFLGGILNENTTDGGSTYAPPIRTTSTGTSADVRGTYTPTTAANGANVYAVRVAFANGPNDSDAFGIAQFATG